MRLSYSQQAWVGGGRKPALAASLQQPLPVLVILKDGLPAVTPIHHMIIRARVLDAQLPRHAPTLMPLLLRSQENIAISLPPLLSCYGVDALNCFQGGRRTGTTLVARARYARAATQLSWNSCLRRVVIPAKKANVSERAM